MPAILIGEIVLVDTSSVDPSRMSHRMAGPETGECEVKSRECLAKIPIT
jgi:hypothetical protein